MSEANTHFVWNRGANINFSRYFNSSEFECTCKKCVPQRISRHLVEKLTYIRTELGFPIKVTSAFRCPARQKELRKSGFPTASKSQHLRGNAVDITCKDFESNALKILRFALNVNIFSVGVAKTFLHLDTREDKERLWIY